MNLNEKMFTKIRNTIISDIGLVLVALFWGGGFVAGKFALISITPLNQMAYRYTGAAFIVFIFCIKKLKGLKNKRLLIYGILCGINMFIGNSLQTIGLQYTTAGKQSFITSMYILLIPLISWLTSGKRPSKSIITAAIIGFFGIACITLTDEFYIGKGDIMTFALAITFSAQVIFISSVIKKIDAMLLTLVQLISVGLISTLATFIFDTPQMPQELLSFSFPCIAGLVYLMTFNSAFAFMLQNISLRYSPASHAAIILSFETVFGTVFAITIAGEVFTPRMILGCFLMFIAIGITEFTTYKASSASNKNQ